jgi:dTDP-4-dehydrorhamnose reductase
VTGASGDLGGVVAARARACGWDVTAWAGRRDVDVRDAEAVERALRDAAPDAVIHTAYLQGGDDEARAVNAGGSEHVARAAAAVGARLVHVSTDAIFDGRLGRPLREEDPPSPVTAYGTTKAEAEARVTRAAPDAVLVRTSLIYAGPPREPITQERTPLAVARGESDMMFYSDEIRSPVQVDDLAGALLELTGVAWAGPLNVAGADALSRLDFARLIVAARGEDAARLRGAPAPPDRPSHCPLDLTRAQALLATPLRGARAVLAPSGR